VSLMMESREQELEIESLKSQMKKLSQAAMIAKWNGAGR
jgi:hypothetical protein